MPRGQGYAVPTCFTFPVSFAASGGDATLTNQGNLRRVLMAGLPSQFLLFC